MLVYFDGRLGEGQRDGERFCQFEAAEENGFGKRTVRMFHVADPDLVAKLRGVQTDQDNPRLLDVDALPSETFSHPSLPSFDLGDFDRPTYSISQSLGFGGYHAVVHPRGDTACLYVAQISIGDEGDWLFASESRFDDERDARDEMTEIAEERGLTIENDDGLNFGYGG